MNGGPMLSKNAIAAARGIGILLVVLGHMRVSGIPPINPYGFHLPLFFFLSGMTLSATRPLHALLARDTRSLLLYAILHYGIFAAITVLLLQPWGFVITTTSPLDWRTYLLYPLTKNSHHVQLFLIAWFLVALFFARLASVLVLKGLVRLPKAAQVITGALLALVLARTGMRVVSAEFAQTQLWYWNLAAQVAVGMSFCLLGYLAQQHGRLVLGSKALAVSLGLYLFLMAAQFGAFVMAWSQYPNGFLRSFAFGAIGTAMVVYAAHALETQGWLKHVGRESKAIMAWHLTVFALFNLVLAAVGLLEPTQTGPFTLLNPPRWWPVYLVVSVLVPVALRALWERVRLRMAARPALREA